jgi:hypothetical protein
MKDRLYKESIARGSLVRVLDLPVPPEPSSMVDGVDLEFLDKSLAEIFNPSKL